MQLQQASDKKRKKETINNSNKPVAPEIARWAVHAGRAILVNCSLEVEKY